jgi:hypothetical protein
MDVRTRKTHFSGGFYRNGSLLVLALLLLLTPVFSACKAVPGKESGEPSEKHEEKEVSWLIAVGPEGEIDTVPAAIRDYIARASEQYASGDFSESVKRQMKGAWPEAEATQFSIEIRETEGVDPKAYQYAIILSETEDFINPRTVAIDPDRRRSMRIGNFRTDAAYYWYVRAEAADGSAVRSAVSTFTTKPGPRLLVIQGVENARDIGNWSHDAENGIPQGLIYRSGKLESGGIEAVDVFVNELGIRTEIDFRNPEEEFVTSFLPEDQVTILVDPIGYYGGFIQDPGRSVKSFRLLTRPDAYPVIFHCKAGADRTGSFAFILEALSGRTAVERAIDYELTGSRYVNADADSEAEGYDYELLIKAFAELPGETDADKAKSFLAAAGLSPMEIQNLELLLSGHGAVLKDPSAVRYDSAKKAVSFALDLRDAGEPIAVEVGGKPVSYTFENDILTIPGLEKGTGTVRFEDGSELLLEWE